MNGIQQITPTPQQQQQQQQQQRSLKKKASESSSSTPTPTTPTGTIRSGSSKVKMMNGGTKSAPLSSSSGDIKSAPSTPLSSRTTKSKASNWSKFKSRLDLFLLLIYLNLSSPILYSQFNRFLQLKLDYIPPHKKNFSTVDNRIGFFFIDCVL